MFNKAPIYIWNEIKEYLYAEEQITLTTISKESRIIKITNLFDFIDSVAFTLLTNDILKKYKDVRKLIANNMITDDGIKHMKLTKLDLYFNYGITNDGIKHMKLDELI